MRDSMMLYHTVILLAIALHRVVSANPSLSQSAPITAHAYLPNFLARELDFIKRQDTNFETICGYGSGNVERTAGPGFNCRVDIKNALWGFCPTTVITASDCGLAGACKDTNSCLGVCGYTDRPDLTTFTWQVVSTTSAFCSSVLLTAGPDQTYSYIACGNQAIVEHIQAAPTADPPEITIKTSSQSIIPPAPKSTTSSSMLSPTITPSSSTILERTSISIGTAELSIPVTFSLTSSSASSLPSVDSSTIGGPLANNYTSKINASDVNGLVGPIIGGVLGLLALTSFVVLGILFLRKYRRDHSIPFIPSSIDPPISGAVIYPPVQTTGLHELHVKDYKQVSRAVELESRRITFRSSPAELYG